MSNNDLLVFNVEGEFNESIAPEKLPIPFFAADDSMLPAIDSKELMPNVAEGDRFIVPGMSKIFSYAATEENLLNIFALFQGDPFKIYQVPQSSLHRAPS